MNHYEPKKILTDLVIDINNRTNSDQREDSDDDPRRANMITTIAAPINLADAMWDQFIQRQIKARKCK